jgi:hypothetical protein
LGVLRALHVPLVLVRLSDMHPTEKFSHRERAGRELQKGTISREAVGWNDLFGGARSIESITIPSNRLAQAFFGCRRWMIIQQSSRFGNIGLGAALIAWAWWVALKLG